MIAALSLARSFLRNLLFAGLAFAIVAPVASTPAFAKKGPLTAAEAKQFKASKARFTQAKAQAKRAIKLLKGPHLNASRELARAAAAARNSRTNLDNLKRRLEDERFSDKNSREFNNIINAPNGRNRRLERMEVAYTKAENFHNQGPKARYDAAAANFQQLDASYKSAASSLAEARQNLAVRKWEKDAARLANQDAARLAKLQAAADRKKAKARKNAPLQYGALPPEPGLNQPAQAQRQNHGHLPAQINYSQLPRDPNAAAPVLNVQLQGFSIPANQAQRR